VTRAALPDNESERLSAVRSYSSLDTAQDEALSALVRAASSACEMPIAVVTLVEEEKQRFLASTGLPGVKETPREAAFCAHSILSREIMVVEDAAVDPRFEDNPLVLGEPGIRFYAGCPLVDQDGFALGALCVIDRVPRTLPAEQAAVLRELSTAVVRLLEAKRIDALLFAAERAAKSARADLRGVLDAATALVAYWDTNLLNRFANVAFATRFGLSSEAVPGMHYRDVIGASFYERDAPALEAVLRGAPQRFARRVEVAGQIRHHDVTLTPDLQGGEVVGFISTTNDLTELKEALVTSEQRNALLLLAEEVGEIGHWRFEAGKDQVYWSDQLYRIHGWDPAVPPTIAGAVAAYHVDDRVRVADALRVALEQNAPFAFELRVVRPDGSIRRVEQKGRCEVDPATGQTRAIFGVSQDVTERAALREQLARQERLITTGTLAAGVGHEISNPLTYVASNLEFALDELRGFAGDAASERTQELLDVLSEAREGAARITTIVRGLRAFAREDAPLAPTDVRSAIEIATNMAAHELRSSTSLLVEAGAEVRRVFSDESRLSQVLVHLLVNAAQAFPTSDPAVNRVTVRCRELPGAERVAVEVEDNGPGIAADVLPRIFDPFFTTKPVGHGTGLGLAISHTLVVSLGGELSCSTQPGKGTTFRVTLPIATSAAPPFA
jgi:PAS domain S-box-containing protein